MEWLGRGDLLPRVTTPLPGPESRRLSVELGRCEPPGINTLPGGDAAIVWRQARGANVLDVDGNVFLDFTSGFGAAAVGHRHPRVVRAVGVAARRLLHGLGDVAAHPDRIRLARRLTELAPHGDAQVYFAVSGAEAVEIALKTALLATGRPGVVAFEPAYHGLTLGALAATSRQAFRRPFEAQLNPHVRRLPFGAPPEELERALAEQEPAGAVIVEPVVGREGVVVPPPGWLAMVADLCRRRGALLIVDEILTGFGRTGTLFAAAAEGVVADLVCCGKALAGGLPLAAVLGDRETFAAWAGTGEALHASTFVAHPLACAAALACLDVIVERRLAERARRLGEVVARRVADWPERFAAVVEVRGRGLLWGVELVAGAAAVAAARERGLLLLAAGPAGQVIELLPPLTITRRQLDAALAILEDVLRVVQ